MKKSTMRTKWLIILFWSILISTSAGWNVYQLHQTQDDVYIETARSFFSLILTTREWNSAMGGVYVPVSDIVQPNPYLEVPDRDLKMPNGVTLTKINPAYMTRLIAELAQTKNNAQFHITSLNPIRPANAPQPWEAAALTAFETAGQREYMRFDGQALKFYYMAPLITQASCLVCHAKQGYREGDIRGGISITMNTQPIKDWPMLVSHLWIGRTGAVLINVFSNRLGKAFEQLEKQSSVDGLTQIFNRAYFDTYFQREFLLSRRRKTALSVLLCDVDLFKSYNDIYGHQAGDNALKKIAQTLSDTLKRPGDMAARYGGEEFVVVLPETSEEGALVLAEMLRASVEQLKIPHQENKVSALVTISIGCATYTGGDTRAEDILEKADQALYQAKRSGRNTVCAQ